MSAKKPLLAKLSSPRLHAAVKRTRLFKLLDQHKRHPIVWISGPPGSGKTTLVASYLETRKASSFWYQIDEGDRDPATLFAYLRDLPRASRGKTSSLPYLTADYLPDLAGFSRRYFRELFRRLGKNCVLVWDNCHAAATEQMETIVRTAAEELPAGVSMILLSRAQPPSALARLQLHGTLVEIGWQELRLTLGESKAIAKTQNTQLKSDIEELHQVADGWVAGLVALINAPRAGTPRRAGRAPQRELLFDYFASEIFAQTPAAQQDVLMRTAIFQQFTVPMAAAVTGDSTVAELLDDLYRRQCFVERSADVYRFHDLFREFLFTRLTETSPDNVMQAKLRAADVLEQQGDSEGAIQLYLDAADMGVAARSIRRVAPAMVDQGRFAQLSLWLARLSEKQFAADPWLRYWLGTSQLFSNRDSALACFRSAYAAFKETQQVDGEIYAIEGALLVLRESWASYTLLDEWIGALAALLPALADRVDLATQLRAWYAYLSAAYDRQLGHPLIHTAIEWFQAKLFDGSLDDNQKLDAATHLIAFAVMNADREHADAIIAIAEPIARNEATAPVRRLLWAFDYGAYLGHGTELERAIEVLSEGIELGQRFGAVGLSYYAYTMRGFAYWWRNEPELAAADFDRMSSIASGAGIPKTVFEYKGRALLASQYGQIDEAMKLALLCIQDADARGPAYMRTYARADMAPIAIQAGLLEQAEQWITEGQEIDRPTIVRANEAQYRAVRASLAFARGDRDAALAHLRASLRIAHNPGVRGELCTSRPQLPMLFGEALNEDIEIDLVIQLIKVWRIPAPGFHVERWPWPIKIRALSVFDVRVDDQPALPARRARVKVLELLKALVAAGPAPTSNDTLIEWLWPDSDGDAAAINLRTTVLRLRQLLRNDAAIVVQDNKVALNADLCWVDAWAFERFAASALPAATSLTPSAAQLRSALRLYQGPLLAQEPFAWAIRPRDKLRARYLAAVEALGQQLEQSGATQEAVQLYQSALEVEPNAPRVQQNLARCNVSATTPRLVSLTPGSRAR